MDEVNLEKGRQNVQKGREFEDEVADLYRLMGYRVQQNIEICQKKVDILASIKSPGTQSEHRFIIECKNEKNNIAQNQRVLQFKGLLEMARRQGDADSAEIITCKPWSDQAKGFALTAGIGLHTYEEKLREIIDFSPYIERVIYDFEHFNEYITSDGHPLRMPVIEPMNRSDLYHKYIPLICRVIEGRGGIQLKPLDEYVEDWLADPHHNHLSILGDFGTGKSSFCLHLTYELAKRYRKDRGNARIPLFISLRDYTKAVSLQQLVTDLLLNKYNVRIASYAVFQRFLENGYLILIFDGFDEMATKTDKALTIRNLQEITNAAVAGSKTILTCRTHYFTDKKHVEETLSCGERNELLLIITRRPSFRIVELEEFSDEQIQKLLSLNNPNGWQEDWVAIRRNLYDLARRPLLLDMIIKTLPQLLEMKKTVSVIHLYDAYTRIWTEIDDHRSRMRSEGKRAFMEDLAMQMWGKGISSINYQDLKNSIRKYFPDQIFTSDDLDYFDYDTRTCSFLNRDPKGNYQFIHKSFMEFFVSKKIYDHLRKNCVEPIFREKMFQPAISSFVAQFVSEDLDALENICHWAFDETKMLASNAISVLSYLKDFRPEKAVRHLLNLCRKTELKSGVTWVFGELGVNNEGVLFFLNEAIRNPERPRTWWEAAFALKKLGVVEDPIGKLIEHLPSEWTIDAGFTSLEKSFKSQDEVAAGIDQRAIVAILKEHRSREGKSKLAIEERTASIFNLLNLSIDTKGRRAYYAVWLFGELRMVSALPTLLIMVKHPQLAVRNMLAEALGKIGSAERTNSTSVGYDGLVVLTKLLADPYYRTRLHAAESIGKIGAVSLLLELKVAFEKEPLRDVQNEMLKAIHLFEQKE